MFNMLLVLHVRCVVSGPKTLAADPSSPVNCEVELQLIGLVSSAHRTLNLTEILNLNQTEIWGIWKPAQQLDLIFLKHYHYHYPAERGQCHQGIPLP